MQTHIISEAFEQLSKSAKLNESKLTEARIMEPKYRDGDVVFTGDATGYHGTFLINGDFRKIPKELYSNIRRICKYGNIDKPYYTVEYRIDSDSLFEKDYTEFFNKIIPMLHDAGISVLKSAKDIKESKLNEAPMSPKEYADMRRARKSLKTSNDILSKINSLITPEMSVTDQLDVYFNELVPPQGEAETIAGEIVRAMMRILYRDYNDGDLWYTGYGVETCGNSVIYLILLIDNLLDDFLRMANAQLEETAYTDALNDIAAKLIVYLNENPELFTTPNTSSSRSGRGEQLETYFDLPTYEFDVDASYDEGEFDVDDDEIDEFINDIVDSDFSGARVNRWARDAWTIEDLDKDQLEYLEEIWEKWFSQFLEEHRREDDYDEDDFDETDDDFLTAANWDDETDEFDESLKESSNYKSGDRYYGGLPAEPSFSEYGKAMKSYQDRRRARTLFSVKVSEFDESTDYDKIFADSVKKIEFISGTDTWWFERIDGDNWATYLNGSFGSFGTVTTDYIRKDIHDYKRYGLNNMRITAFRGAPVQESLKETIDISTYEEVSSENRGGTIYRLFRKFENGKGKWAAIELCDGKDCGEPFEITYEQARGFEPMNSIEKTGMALGKKLLPKREAMKKSSKRKSDKSKEIYDYLDELGGYVDYDGKIDCLVDDFGLSREDAESFVWDWSSGLNKLKEKLSKVSSDLAEDFNETNLEKMGTNEYEANSNRDKHIKIYRKFANLSDTDAITEDTINEYALNKTATYCNREPERIKSEILGQRYSEYER